MIEEHFLGFGGIDRLDFILCLLFFSKQNVLERCDKTLFSEVSKSCSVLWFMWYLISINQSKGLPVVLKSNPDKRYLILALSGKCIGHLLHQQTAWVRGWIQKPCRRWKWMCLFVGFFTKILCSSYSTVLDRGDQEFTGRGISWNCLALLLLWVIHKNINILEKLFFKCLCNQKK